MKLEDLWDKNSEKAQELHNIASLIYGDNHIVIFDKFIFIPPDKKRMPEGKLIDDTGNIINDEVVNMYPLMIEENSLPIGWIIIDNETFESISRMRARKQIYSIVNNLKGISGHNDIIQDIDIMVHEFVNKYTEVKVIEPNGLFSKAKIMNDKQERLKFKGKEYYKVVKGFEGIHYVHARFLR